MRPESRARGTGAIGLSHPEFETPSSFHVVDVNGYDLQISGIEMTALAVGG